MKSLGILFVGGATLAVVASLGGASCSQPGSSPDASRDAQTADSAVDAARADGGADGDSPPWNGSVPAPGEWVTMPGLPPACSTRIAKDAASSIPPLPWTPCPSGRAGCQSFHSTWAVESPMPPLSFQSNEPVFEGQSGPMLAYQRWEFRARPNDGEIHSFNVLQALHGPAELAVYSRNGKLSCFSALAASRHGVGLEIGFSASPSSYEVFLAAAGLGESSRLTATRVTSQLGSKNIIQILERGESFLTLERVNAGAGVALSILDIASGQVSSPGGGGLFAGEKAFPTKGGYFAYAVGATPTIDYFTSSGSHQPVVRPLAGSSLVFYTVDRGDGDALYWEESTSDNAPAVLYTSPFATTEAGLKRRAFAKLPKTTRGTVNKGLFLVRTDNFGGRLIRASDGLGWPIASETGIPLMDPAWVNDESVWFFTSEIQPGEPGFPISGGMFQFDRAGLGAPPLPSGL